MQNADINDFNETDLNTAIKGTKKKGTVEEREAKVARQNFAAYAYARDNGHMEYVNDAKKFDDFYVGKQWDESDKKTLEASGRPALTINKILPTINTILGEQILREADIKFLPVSNANLDTANTLNKLYLHVKHANKYNEKEAQVFADGVIQERGFFDVRMDFDTNIQGDLKITVDDPIDTWIDPHAKDYDPATWGEVGTTRWLSPAEIEADYGDDALNKLKEFFAGDTGTIDFDAFKVSNKTFGGEDEHIVQLSSEDEQDERHVKSIRVIDRQHAKYVRARVFIDPEFGDIEEVPTTWDEERAALFAEEVGLILGKRSIRKIRWTVTAGDKLVLHDAWSPYRTYTKIPFFPYFRRGRPMGMIRNLISPQEQLNKTESQMLHVVNTTANSGYIVEQGAMINMTVDELREKGAETGIVIETAPNRKEDVKKIQPNQIPSGLDRLASRTDSSIREISAINDAQMGTETSSKVSGVALEHRAKRGAITLEKPFANLASSRQMVATKILELIQDFYVEERVFNIINEFDLEEAPEELVINQMDIAGEIVNNVTLGKYDVVVSTQPSRDTFADTQFAQVLDMRNSGVMIPDDTVVELSPLASRSEIAERMRSLAGTGEPSEEEQAMQQQQQEIQQQFQMLEMEKLNAEIQSMAADAQLKLAKASTEEGAHERLLEELESELQKKREELDLRYKLANLSAQSKERVTLINAQNKAASDHLNRVEGRIRDARKSPDNQSR